MTPDQLREAVARATLAADTFLVESGHHHWEYKSASQRDHYLALADAAIAIVVAEMARVAEVLRLYHEYFKPGRPPHPI